MQDENDVSPLLLPLQTVVGAMIVGVVTLGVVCLFIGPLTPGETATARMLLLVLGMLGIGEFVGFQIARTFRIERLRRITGEPDGPSGSESDVFAVFRALTLIRAAMCEGFTMFALVIVLLHGERLALGAAALGLLLLVTGMPTRMRYASFLERVTGGNPYAGD